MSNILLEIGTEEIPAGYIIPALRANGRVVCRTGKKKPSEC